ncbi:27016_t:CDS:2, partial [Racocetra persica]
ESDDNISQLINYSNESNKDNLEFMHIDNNNFLNIKLEIIAKNQSEDSNYKYLTELFDSFYKTEKSEEETDEPKMMDILIPGKKEDKEKFKKYEVKIYTQGSTTNFLYVTTIRVLLQNCKPRLNDHNNDQIEVEIKNINFEDITTIFDNEKIVIDYDYNDEVEITANSKKVK